MGNIPGVQHKENGDAHGQAGCDDIVPWDVQVFFTGRQDEKGAGGKSRHENVIVGRGEHGLTAIGDAKYPQTGEGHAHTCEQEETNLQGLGQGLISDDINL